MFGMLWFVAGISGVAFGYWAIRLSFRDPVTLGTALGFAVGMLLPPLAFFFGIVVLCAWAFGAYDDQCRRPVKWSKGWTAFRYAQHRFVRNVWHLGRPPAQEDVLSGWRHYR